MIKIDQLDFGYRRGKLFRDLDLKLEQGTVYGLLGKNGAGKTTLLKLICGLLFPASGTVNVNGCVPRDREPDFLNQIFFVPEEFDLPPVSVRDYAESFGKFYPNFSWQKMIELLSELEVSDMQKFNQMSFGQKKKAYLAFAIACNTPILILDEPTNGLDIPSKSNFRRVVSTISNQEKTIIISTHQVRDLDQLIDSVVILDNSEILVNARCQQITDKLLFAHIPEGGSALYSERTIHGTWGVLANTTGEESPLDIELLFNAAIYNRDAIRAIFNQ